MLFTVVNRLLRVEAVRDSMLACVNFMPNSVDLVQLHRSFAIQRSVRGESNHSRSLLSSEALVDDFGVAIDSEVANRGGVRRGRRAVSSPRQLLKETGS